jgi:dUTP pyrophosphatase
MTDRQSVHDAVQIEVNRLPHAEDLDLPEYATALSAGMDLRAAIAPNESITLAVGERRLIPTGLKIGLPPGFEAQVRPRSGLAVKHGVTVLNSPGTIDADYRGEVKVILVNHGTTPFEIRRGDRIAQMIVARHATVRWFETDELSSSERGEGGFGHTGH